MSDYDAWIEMNVPDLTGKVALVTGANSGLGFETTKVLASKGAHVVMAVRDATKGESAACLIRAAYPAASLELRTLDLASLASIRACAASLLAEHDRLDLQIDNAGVMAIPYGKTADGFERQFGTNHLGHFALAGLLMPLVLATPAARVVTVSSSAHLFGQIDFDNLNGERSYSKWGAYGQTKLANLLFAYELQRRLAAAGSAVISVAAHPGYANTNLQAVGAEMEGSKFGKQTAMLGNKLLAQSAAMGALPTICAATCANARGGDYFGPDGFMAQRGFPKKMLSSSRSHDQAAAARLWTISEQLTGVVFSFG